MRQAKTIRAFATLALAACSLAGCAGNGLQTAAGSAACITRVEGDTAPPDCTVTNPVATTGSIAIMPPPPSFTAGGSALDAVAKTPEIMAAEARTRAAEGDIDIALAAKRPTAALLASFGGGAEHSSAYNSGPASRYSGNTYSYALGVDVPLYQGGRTDAAIEAARADHRASGEAATDRRVATGYELALALLRIQQQRELLTALDRQRSALGRLRDNVKTELDAGNASRVDLDDIARQFARIAVIRETALLTIAEAERTTKRLGSASNAKLPRIASLKLGENKQALIALALQNNPRLRERGARLDAAKARITQAEGELLPTVSMGLRVGGEKGDLVAPERIHGGRAELRFSMPFDLSGVHSATIRRRSDEKLAAQFDRDAALDGVSAAVNSAFDRRARARRMHALAETERRSAVKMLDGVREERKVGERSTFDEIRAIENLTNAETNMAIAKYELNAAEFTLAAETGAIDRLIAPSAPLSVAQAGK